MLASFQILGNTAWLTNSLQRISRGVASSAAHSWMIRALSPSGPQALCRPMLRSSEWTFPEGTVNWASGGEGKAVALGRSPTWGSENFDPNVALKMLAQSAALEKDWPLWTRLAVRWEDDFRDLTKDQKRLGLSGKSWTRLWRYSWYFESAARLNSALALEKASSCSGVGCAFFRRWVRFLSLSAQSYPLYLETEAYI